MNWRDRARRLVNRPYELSGWRLALIRLVDPVEWYMRKDEHRPRALPGRPPANGPGSVAYAPLARDGGRPVTDEAVDVPTTPSPPRSTGSTEDWEARRSSLIDRYRGYFTARALEVLAGQPASIRTVNGTLRAKLVRFRNGAVLERDVVGPHGTGHGMTRLDSRALRDPVPVIVDYLIDEVARLGPGAVPLT